MMIVSACLAGVKCRYNTESKPDERVIRLVRQGKAIPVCPEQLGGLSTPRAPSEIVGDRVMQNDGTDVTENFERGAQETLRIATLAGAKQAILKSKSAACGCGMIYDGTFSGKLIEGYGTAALLLKQNNIEVRTEEEL